MLELVKTIKKVSQTLHILVSVTDFILLIEKAIF
jgi:hypothetical protein